MTPEEYWEGDCTLVRDYREAAKLKRERHNEDMWLQGLYIYQAMCAVSPILRAFAKKNTKPLPYMDKPLPITKRQTEENNHEEEKAKMEKGKKFMELYAVSHNKRFKQTEVKQDVDKH